MPASDDKTERLLARTLGLLAERFKNQLILKGGMLLRLLNSPRKTQDLDYCWIRTKKRTLLGAELKKTIEEMEGVRVKDVQSNSRGIFVTFRDENAEAVGKIEVNVVTATRLPPQPMSTAPLTNRHALRTQVITVMALPEAMSHKIAAALERNLVRDLYDLSQLEPLTSFDPMTLGDRLSKLEIERSKPRRVGLEEAANLLRARLDPLTPKKIGAELIGWVPDEFLPGLDLVIRTSILRIVERMRSLKRF